MVPPDATPENVRFAELRPDEIRRRRAVCPVAFVPLGTLEWHGEHLPVGLDGIKAEALCVRAAERAGGFAFPTMWWGAPRQLEHMEGDQLESDAVRRSYGIRSPSGATADQELKAFQAQFERLLEHLRDLEMHVVCVVCGHYPLGRWTLPVAQRFAEQESSMRIATAIDPDWVPASAPPAVAGADHAAKWETSYMLALRPDLVDMTRAPHMPEEVPGLIGEPPGPTASETLGSTAVSWIVDGLVSTASRLLDGVKGSRAGAGA